MFEDILDSLAQIQYSALLPPFFLGTVCSSDFRGALCVLSWTFIYMHAALDVHIGGLIWPTYANLFFCSNAVLSYPGSVRSWNRLQLRPQRNNIYTKVTIYVQARCP